MSEVKDKHYYTDDHEWARLDGEDMVVIGITDYAQEHLGDVVMVELPDVGDETTVGEAFGTVESPKSVSDLFSPIAGEVVAVNDTLEDSPETVNEDPFGDGWIVKIHVPDVAALTEYLSALMSPQEYRAHLAELEDA